MIGFFRNLLGVKTDEAVQGALETLVRWDPHAATEAELRTMEDHLDQLGLQVAEARAAYERERREADEIDALSRQRMAAAEDLQRQLAQEANSARKADLEKSLSTLVDLLERMTPDVERETRDANDAHEFLKMLEDAYGQAGAKLKAARDELGRAQRDMGRAEQQRRMAEDRAEAARRAAGLGQATGSLNVALKAMQDRAARDLAAAEAANAKAAMLRPSRPETDDRNIADAMAKAAGKPVGQESVSQRLDRLRIARRD